MTRAKTASTINSAKKISNRKRVLALGPIKSFVTSPMERPRLRAETTSAPKSCTAPIKIDPRTTHRSAGSQPQITAMAGPTIGAAPAIDVKWWPNSMWRFVGT